MFRALLSAGLAGTLVLGVAEAWKQSGSPELERLGLQITPGDAAAWMRLSQQSSGARALHALQRASDADPRNSLARLMLGLRWEAQGDLARAREELERAVYYDRGYLPVWTLANFCLRHGDANYLPLLKQSLAIAVAGSQDTSAVFDVAWQTGNDLTGNDLTGNDPRILPLYVAYLIHAGHSEAVLRSANRLADPEMRLKAAEYLMDSGRVEDFQKLTGVAAFNSGMDQPRELSFDWKFTSTPEHSVDFQGQDQGVRIDLSGGQDEQIDILSERIAVTPGARYRLAWETKLGPEHAHPKLLWVVSGTRVDAAASGFADFTGIANARLVLRLERSLGEQAFAGTVWVRRPSVHAIGPQ